MSLVNNANSASFQSIPTTLQAMQCFPSTPTSNLLGNGCRKIQYLDDGTQCIEWANGVIEKTQKNPFFVLGEKVVCPILDKVVYPVTDIFRLVFSHPFFMERAKKLLEGFSGGPVLDEELIIECLTIPQSESYVSETPAVLDAMLKRRIQNRELIPGNAAWTEMQKLMMRVSSKILMNIFEENYKHFKQHHDSLSGACFHVLLKMVVNENYVLPESWNDLNQGIISYFSTIDFSDTSGRSRPLDLLTSAKI